MNGCKKIMLLVILKLLVVPAAKIPQNKPGEVVAPEVVDKLKFLIVLPEIVLLAKLVLPDALITFKRLAIAPFKV